MKNGMLPILQRLVFALSLVFASVALAEPLNLSILKKEITAYHDSGFYEKELACVINQAKAYLSSQIAINTRLGNKRKLALVLDIDETSLSNYPRMAKRQFDGNKAQITQDIQAADAPAINPTLALYTFAKQHGVDVFFVTGRSTALLQATQKNLVKAGYNNWDGLFFKPNNYHQASIIPFKAETRKLIEQKGYTIVASIGDQFSDIKGGYAQKGFKLPNPYYYLP
ncbi:MAG: HAD family acid phosphatase [Tatlockia sp.]|jgi:predicted secreted acid phosphatase